MRRSLFISLFSTLAIAAIALLATLAVGNTPQLGLDLQGGASIVLKPKSDVPSDVLDQTISIIRKRVDGLGVAEPEITRQGKAIVVELPGVKDQERARELVGKTAELRFRPVLGVYPGKDTAVATTTTSKTGTTVAGSTPSTVASATSTGATTAPASSTSSSVSASSTAVGGAGKARTLRATATTDAATTLAPATTVASSATTAAATPTSVATGTTVAATGTTVAPAVTTPVPSDGLIPLTTSDQDTLDATVVLPEIRNGKEVARYQLGPAPLLTDGKTRLNGEAVTTATAQFSSGSNQWVTQVDFKSGQNGIDGFNALSIQCYDATATCPTKQTAIVLDGQVLSAPVPQQRGFSGNQIEISGGNQKASQAKDLALALKYGALPVQLVPQQVQTVSATLGKDSLRAGVVAGLVGVLLVIAFMTIYYKTMGGLVLLAGLSVSASLLWSIVSYLGNTNGLALTLSGATGIIVSIGVTVDSYVVYFERLKDDVRLGKTLRASAERGFQGAYRTIIAADSVSLLGAVVLWYLTVGSVRGFAFFLGLSTVLDMFVAFFFTRPLVIWISRSGRFMRDKVFGVTIGEAHLSAATAGSSAAIPPRPKGSAR